MGADLASRLESARTALLDLTARNRLLSTPRGGRSRTIEVTDELAHEVFRILVLEKRPMSFLPAADAPEEDATEPFSGMAPPEEEDLDERGVAARHRDTKLQTRLAPETLQKRLLQMYYDARTYEEEQGANLLFLACGFLEWIEEDAPEKHRFAPLLLIPVVLERRSAAARFRIRWLEEELATNLSLQAKLESDFGIDLPDLPELEDLDPVGYADEVARRIVGRRGWNVFPHDMVLGFFTFAKFLMYRDLDPAQWPGLLDHPVLGGLLGTGLEMQPPLFDDEGPIDDRLDPLDTVHVLDSDSSQSICVEEIRRGRNLVIQGPPGTGKSQTIANLIGAAVKEGKRVLFVAEKRAALEVVKRRLDHIGVGDACLELHSHKARKRAVLDELERTLALGPPKGGDVEATAERLRAARDRLNGHARLLHAPCEPSGLTPYRVIGELVRLRADDRAALADFALEKAETWTPDMLRERRALLADYARHVAELGTPAGHPWRGVGLATLLPMDRERLAARIPPLARAVQALQAAHAALADALGMDPPATMAEGAKAGRIARHLAAAPPGTDRAALADALWEQRDRIEQLCKAGSTLRAARDALEGKVAAVAWETDVTDARRDLAAHGRSLFRWLRGSYRRAVRTLEGICSGDAPRTLADRLALLDALMAGRAAWKELIDSNAIGRAAFGTLWNGDASDFGALERVRRWEAEGPPGFRKHAAAPAENLERLAARVEERAISGDLLDDLELSLDEAFGAEALADVDLQALAERLAAWQADPEGVMGWIAFRTRAERVAAHGMAGLAARVYDARIAPEVIGLRFETAYFEAVLRDLAARHPELSTFDGLTHARTAEEFRKLDLERIRLARLEVARAHFDGLPRAGAGIGQLGLLRREMKKKRRHLPLRRLMREAGSAIQATKPVFMMSPLSVAQYLEPGAVEFDLLLVDEASQVQPVDAFGAIARAKQAVVVGDERQLPPTRFFTKEYDGEDEDDYSARDLESILGLCSAQGVPQRMLRWHYRSRHHSLIAVSNREFYDGRLYVIPHPQPDPPHLGLRRHFVEAGVFDRGGTATNPVEAQRVADAVIEHARNRPGETLGVGTFSIRQRDAILDELERRWRTDDEVRDFFRTDGPEPFFVKNLENIQGDERDVIFISVGYAKDEGGFMSMNLGPVSADGGERRLNVLITRARRRCEVFSSVGAADIDLARGKGRGVAALKAFLAYAESGDLDGRPLSGDAGSAFEARVADALRAEGLAVDPRVGLAGVFLDLAVRDPDDPKRYVLGIECDGPDYFAARWARDRDRLRDQVLQSHGWRLHRLWCADWFQRPEEQLQKVLAAVREQKPKDAPPSVPAATRAEPKEPAPLSVPYEEASFDVPSDTEPHEVKERKMASIVRKIVQVEGPVHEDEVARRVTALWGKSRTGSRIQAAVEAAIARAEVERDGAFLSPPGIREVRVRDRERVESAGLRRPEMLPPAEIRAGVLRLVEVHHGAPRDDVVRETGRLLGYRATSEKLAERIGLEVSALLDAGRLAERNGLLVVAE